jgi:triacylglycerol esterase/lipase EstA (alpha/beta hydrolase family)
MLALTALVLTVAAAAAPLDRRTVGLNDWNCKAQPGLEPVILLHGLFAPSFANFFTIGPELAKDKRCVYWIDYGTPDGTLLFGGESMYDSVNEVSAFVDKVLASTGAAHVNIVGHSMGTAVGTMYTKKHGAAKVKHYVGFGSAVHGTTLLGLNKLALALKVDQVVDDVCPGCVQIVTPSPFLTDLAAGGITVPGPTYTTIVSKFDQVVTPWESRRIGEPGATDITIQDLCPLDIAGHDMLALDPNVLRIIRWALNGSVGPAIPKGTCVPFLLAFKREDE